MKNINKFLELYNALHQQLKIISSVDNNEMTFRVVLDFVASNNSYLITKEEKSFLYSVNNLRNALLHNTINEEKGLYLADPNTAIVEQMQGILDKLKSTPTVNDIFCKNKHITTASASDILMDIVNKMVVFDYDLLPITTNNKLQGVVTKNNILNAIHLMGYPDLNKVTVGEVVKYLNKKNMLHSTNYVTISPKCTTSEALEKLSKANYSFDALIITENGDRHSDILGIITRSQEDLLLLNSKLLFIAS